MTVERREITVDDLDAAIASHEAEGYRLLTISPADDPRRADMDGPGAIRLVRRADAPPATGRAGMIYRDLIPDRLGGSVIASHITIPVGGPVPDYVHHHDITFQMIFCHAGWVRVVYEDQGPPFVMEAGDCVLQPPGIRHRVLASGDGLEVVEVGSPAEHDTHRDHELELPTPDLVADRDFGGQRFVRHVHSDTRWRAAPDEGWEVQEFGLAEATGGIADARLARTAGQGGPLGLGPEPTFVFVRRGAVTVNGPITTTGFAEGDSIMLAEPRSHRIWSDSEVELLVVDLPSIT